MKNTLSWKLVLLASWAAALLTAGCGSLYEVIVHGDILQV